MPSLLAWIDWAATGTTISAAMMAITTRAWRGRPKQSASRISRMTAAGQSSQVIAGAGVSSQPKLPIIWWMKISEWSKVSRAAFSGVNQSGISITELSGCVIDQAMATPVLAARTAAHTQVALVRTTMRMAERWVSSSAQTTAPANQTRPSGRMLISTRPPIASLSSRRFSRARSGAMNIGSAALQTRTPAAISGPLGFTTPPMYRVVGVRAASSPAITIPRRRHSAAATTALASSAAQNTAEASRIRYSPGSPETIRLGQPTRV